MKTIRPPGAARTTTEGRMLGRFLAVVLSGITAATSVSARPTDPPAPIPPSPPAEQAAPSSSAAPAPSAPSAAQSPEDKKAEALAHFEKGKKLVKEGAWAAAYTEYMESRKLFPTRSATASAVICLKQLQRYDEALDLDEALLREFPDMPADMKAAAQRELVELRGRVGTIEIRGAELGAAVTIDRQSRGEYPALGPLRAAAGHHIVRVYKEGFEPFEQGLDVVGGQTTAVKVHLVRLLQAGRLKVEEASGKRLDVLFDGNVVGQTPWEGPVAAGEHAVELRGAEGLGALPKRIAVRLNERAKVVFTAERLDASLKVVPLPGGCERGHRYHLCRSWDLGWAPPCGCARGQARCRRLLP
jgi:hypothetical protein